jgi:hypothetical protein
MSIYKSMLGQALAVMMIGAAPGYAADEIPRAASTPTTPKNWVAPAYKMKAQALVDELVAGRPEIISITIHAIPPGKTDMYTMIAGTFPDRIGNESSPGDIITAKKGVTQVESKWGTENYKQKVSIVLPLKDASGKYLPVALIIAFATSPQDPRKDTDFMQPGVALRDSIQSKVTTVAALFEPAK